MSYTRPPDETPPRSRSRWGSSVAADIRYTFRQIARAPIFTAVILFVLAIGIGANSAVFTIVRAFTTRPAPGIPHAGELARVTPIYMNGKTRVEGFKYPVYAAIRDRADLFTDAAAWETHGQTSIEVKGQPVPANILSVTGGYFTALALHMARGRTFGSRNGRDSAETPVAVVSYGYWQRAFGGDSAIIGNTLMINGISLTIVGVAPERFNGVDGNRTDVYVPLGMTSLVFPEDLGLTHLSASRVEALLSLARQRIGALPGVMGVSVVSAFPLLIDFDPNEVTNTMETDTGAVEMAKDTLIPWVVNSDPNLFAMGVLPMRRGRPIDSTDVKGAPPVVVVSEDLARRMWPKQDPIGRTFTNYRLPVPATVIGVVGTVHMISDTTEATPAAYVSIRQFPDTFSLHLLVRTSRQPKALVAPVRSILTSLDHQLYVHDVETFAQTRADAGAVLEILRDVGLLSALALLLASMGVYAVVAFNVGQRTREIGIRMALGADAGEVTRLFFRGGMRLTAIGIGIGLLLAFVVIRVVMQSAGGAEGISYVDLCSYAVLSIALVMPIVTGAATWVPARRAARVDPLLALRSE